MKIVRVLILLVTGFAWVAGCSTSVINELYRTRLIPDDYRYGDLYRLSNLQEFKDPKSECGPTLIRRPDASKKIALYIIGDSFAEPQRLDSSDFAVNHYQYAHWGTLLHLRLDTSYTNIVLLQSVERNVHEHFGSPIANILPDSATFVSVPEDTRFISRLDHLFASASTEDRLTTLLFQYDPMLKLKEWKSWLNHHFFNRTDPKVTVSGNQKTIVYHVDTDTTMINSSFRHTTHAEVDSLVEVLNFNQQYLKSLGFDEVWYSIVPNKASVLMPGYGIYNRLIERIGQHPSLRVASIDVLDTFRKMSQNPFLKGDSHWSCEGQAVWLEIVNDKLNEVAGQKKSPALEGGTSL
jgi:hypothetical protein